MKDDADGLPRIVLRASGTYANGLLHFDCHRVDGKLSLELYVTRHTAVPLPPRPFGYLPPSEKVSYIIKGGSSLVRHWEPAEYDSEFEGFFAPPAVMKGIFTAMYDGGGNLTLSWKKHKLAFETKGFALASKPVTAVCGLP